MPRIFDQFIGPSSVGSDATRCTVRLFWLLFILSNASSNNFHISSPPSWVFCPRPVGWSSLILDDGGAISLRSSRSVSSTGATSGWFDLRIFEFITKFPLYPTSCNTREYAVPDSRLGDQLVGHQLLLSRITKSFLESERPPRGYLMSVPYERLQRLSSVNSLRGGCSGTIVKIEEETQPSRLILHQGHIPCSWSKGRCGRTCFLSILRQRHMRSLLEVFNNWGEAPTTWSLLQSCKLTIVVQSITVNVFVSKQCRYYKK